MARNFDLVNATQLKAGDYIDLEGDRYGDNDMATFEYAEVENTEVETEACIVIYTSQTSFGCPVDHKIKLVGKADETTGEPRMFADMED